MKGVFGSTHLRRDLGRELQHGGERAASCRLLLLVNYGQVPLTAEVHVAAGIGACTKREGRVRGRAALACVKRSREGNKETLPGHPDILRHPKIFDVILRRLKLPGHPDRLEANYCCS